MRRRCSYLASSMSSSVAGRAISRHLQLLSHVSAIQGILPNAGRNPAFGTPWRSLHGYNRQNLRFQNDEVSGQTTLRAEPEETGRRWKDTLLSSPGALSADNEAEHLFITDTNHHRVIVANGDGKVLDCIGSSPGMQDGAFETAQMCYPASTIFDADQNFIYIADSENHAIRRADLSKRNLDTIYPQTMGDTKITAWGRFLRWIGTFEASKSEQEFEKVVKSAILRYPWHLKYTRHGLIIASRCFKNIWLLDSNSGDLMEFQTQGSEAVSEEFLTRANDVKEMEDLCSVVCHEMKGKASTKENPWQIFSVIDVVSRVVRLHNGLFFIDTDDQLIRRYDLESGSHKPLHLTNVGLLGLPWWWSLPSVNTQSTNGARTGDNVAHALKQEAHKLHHEIHILPGRFLLCFNPVPPVGMAWAAPVEVGSIWRQARGSVVELSMFEGSLMSYKISSAQQWLDDLDDIDDPDSDKGETQELTLPQQSETGIPFYSLLDASLGAGEIIIDAVLYLKYAASQDSREEFVGSLRGNDEQGVSYNRAVHQGDQIFLKHLHVNVKLVIETSAPEERTKHITVHL